MLVLVERQETNEKDFSLVSCLCTSTNTRSDQYLDSGESHHMKKAWEKFSSLIEKDSWTHVELGDDTKYVVKGEGTIWFHLELGGSFED
jgi:hypothetical protein